MNFLMSLHHQGQLLPIFYFIYLFYFIFLGIYNIYYTPNILASYSKASLELGDI